METKAKRARGGLSSAGRAPALQAGGREFESLSLHQQIERILKKDLKGFILSAVRTLKTEYREKVSGK